MTSWLAYTLFRSGILQISASVGLFSGEFDFSQENILEFLFFGGQKRGVQTWLPEI